MVSTVGLVIYDHFRVAPPKKCLPTMSGMKLPFRSLADSMVYDKDSLDLKNTPSNKYLRVDFGLSLCTSFLNDPENSLYVVAKPN